MSKQVEYANVINFIQAYADVHIVHVYPAVGAENRRYIESELLARGEIYFKKDVKFSRSGLINCKKISYDRQGFGGGFTDHFWGYRKHAKKSIGGSSRPTMIYVVRGTLDEMRRLKESMRKRVGRGTWPIHITDSHEEAIALSEIYFNPNALAVFNARSYLYDSAKIDKVIDDFKAKVLDLGFSLEDVCVAGSVPMAICGIRRSKDCDYLSTDTRVYVLKDKIYSPHDSQLKYYPATKEEIVRNPRWYFKYRGVKVLSLEGCLRLKLKRRGWPKDHKDILRILWFLLKANARKATASIRFMGFKPWPWRERIINALYRFAYLGPGVSFPEYCRVRGYNYNRDVYGKLLGNRPIVRVEPCRVPVGLLRSRLFGEKYKMADSLPFKAMCGEVKYSDYIEKVHRIEGIADYNPGDDYAAQFLDKIRQEGFDPKHPIIINNKNYIIDGQHRSCTMLKLFGAGYQIHALRIYTLPRTGSLLGRIFRVSPQTYPISDGTV